MRYSLLIFMWFSSCAYNSPHIDDLRAHPIYPTLSNSERTLLEQIMSKAIDSEHKDYYFKYLKILLNTPVDPPENTRKLNNGEIRQSIRKVKKIHKSLAHKGHQRLEKYINKEEDYETVIPREWYRYRPDVDDAYFYVSEDNCLDILVNIRVRLNGKYKDVQEILLLEDAIEKHLYMPGYSVNLVFVKYSGKPSNDIFDVNVRLDKWTTSHNWSGGAMVLAHELLHLMGLPDEYNRIKVHSRNSYMSIYMRLAQFYYQMDQELLPDASEGIMCWHGNKPLQRHICASVGLGNDCIEQRKATYGN